MAQGEEPVYQGNKTKSCLSACKTEAGSGFGWYMKSAPLQRWELLSRARRSSLFCGIPTDAKEDFC